MASSSSYEFKRPLSEREIERLLYESDSDYFWEENSDDSDEDGDYIAESDHDSESVWVKVVITM